MYVYNVNQGCLLANSVELADTFKKRLVGLLGRRDLPLGSAMFISPCNSVHTVAMRFPIDVMFIDNNYCIIKIIHHMRPNYFSPIIRKAAAAVELPAGTLWSSGTKIGDEIKVNSFSKPDIGASGGDSAPPEAWKRNSALLKVES